MPTMTKKNYSLRHTLNYLAVNMTSESIPLRWKIFRIVCILQLLAATGRGMETLFYLLPSISFSEIAALLVFTAILLLCLLGVNIVNNNLPDEPVQGSQKKRFNRLFILNFLFLAILFGFVIADIRSLKEIILLTGRHVTQLPTGIYLPLATDSIILFFQLLILLGLARLRIELEANFSRRKFEFEKP